MAVEDFIETEVGVAVAATAALFSPRVRNVARRGAVYGLAGALKAGDAVGSAARGVARGVRGGQEPAPPAEAPAPVAGAGRQPRARSQTRAPGTPAEAQP